MRALFGALLGGVYSGSKPRCLTHICKGDRWGGLRTGSAGPPAIPQLCDARWDAFAGRTPWDRRREGPTLPTV
jgi:hypothetical protein